MYLEGFEEEGIVESRTDSDPTIRDERIDHSTGTVDRQHEAVFSSHPGEFAAYGIPETTI